MSPLPTRLHALPARRVRLIAASLFVGTVALLFSNQDAGFTRDESFYFDFSERYQEWFVDVEHANDPVAREAAFSREPTVRIWSGNFEHPPLAKELFGFSWRIFARKDRRIGNVVVTPEDRARKPEFAASDAEPPRLLFSVFAGRATGFDPGAEVVLLSPQLQGQRQTSEDRIIARGRVVTREAERADVEVSTSLTLDRMREIDALCARPLPSEPAQIPITGCMAREVRTLDILSESEAMRLPGILSSGLAVMLTFLLGEALFGWLIALFASLLFIFVPEHFFHGYLACFDMPIVAAQMLTFYAFWRSLEDRRWALVAGLAWGLAIVTKHNAFFVPFSLIMFWLLAGARELSLKIRPLSIQLPRLPRAFLVMPVVGLAMLFALWPRLWYSPLQSLRDWFSFHLHHEHYMQYWFGEPLQVPPFPLSYPFEKTALTYPETFLVLFGIGTAFLLALFLSERRASRSPGVNVSFLGTKVGLFVLVNGLIPIAIIALPSTPIFGGIKHWMTGAPFLALVAVYGLFSLARTIRLPTLASVALAVLVIAHPAKASVENAWLGTNYYNSLFAGGLQGAADKRLMRIFWGHEARYACDWLNANAPRNARVFWQDATFGTYDMYQREGWLRQDIRYVNSPDSADIALNETLQALWEGDLRTRKAFDVPGPLWVLSRHGVPYLNVYVRRSLGLTGPVETP